jgi:hypothetical protein
MSKEVELNDIYPNINDDSLASNNDSSNIKTIKKRLSTREELKKLRHSIHGLEIGLERALSTTSENIQKRASKLEVQYEELKLRGCYFVGMWALWLVVGTAFYASKNGLDLTFCKAFYMSVNVGYSIGWGYPFESTNSQYAFSTLYLMTGGSFVAIALGFFANAAVAQRENWFEHLLKKDRYEEGMNAEHMSQRIWTFVDYHWIKIRVVLVWLIWAVFGIILYATMNRNQFWEATLFSTSSMSTGGLKAISQDSPDWEYFVVGAFAATGVPLMGLAMATIASTFISTSSVEETHEILSQAVSDEEIKMMQKFGLENDDGNIDFSEFLILCLIRLNAVNPQLVSFIKGKYDIYDLNSDGSLTYEEIRLASAQREEDCRAMKDKGKNPSDYTPI